MTPTKSKRTTHIHTDSHTQAHIHTPSKRIQLVVAHTHLICMATSSHFHGVEGVNNFLLVKYSLYSIDFLCGCMRVWYCFHGWLLKENEILLLPELIFHSNGIRRFLCCWWLLLHCHIRYPLCKSISILNLTTSWKDRGFFWMDLNVFSAITSHTPCHPNLEHVLRFLMQLARGFDSLAVIRCLSLFSVFRLKAYHRCHMRQREVFVASLVPNDVALWDCFSITK